MSMWRRKNKNQGKEIKFAINMGGVFHVPLPPARFDKGTCIILINGKEVVLDKDGIILEINVNNSRPIKLKIFPDYRNRKLDALEIIDINDNKDYPNSPKLEFVGIGHLSGDDIKNRINILNDLINRLERDRSKFIRKIRRNSYISIVILLVMLGVLSYFAHAETGSIRYFEIFVSLIDVFVILLNLRIIKKTKINTKTNTKTNTKINKKKIIKDKLKMNKKMEKMEKMEKMDVTDIEIVKEK